MVYRYELTDDQWIKIEKLLPGKKEDPGQTAESNRTFVSAVLWVLRSGARLSDLPEKYSKCKSVHKQFSRWAHRGIWEKIFGFLTKDKDNEYLMIDSTLV